MDSYVVDMFYPICGIEHSIKQGIWSENNKADCASMIRVQPYVATELAAFSHMKWEKGIV